MKRELVIFTAVGLLSALAGIFVFNFIQPQPGFSSAVQNPADSSLSYEQLSFQDVDGQIHALSEWKQPLQLINFWAPWCAPCRREIPALIQIQQQYADTLQIIGLAFDSAENVNAFAPGYAFNYPLLLVGPDSAALNRFFGNQSGGLPYTVILDKQRNIVYRHAGEINKQQLDHQLDRLLLAQQ